MDEELLELHKEEYEYQKPLSEEIAERVKDRTVSNLLEDLLMQANLAIPDGKIAHNLGGLKRNFRENIALAESNGYAGYTFEQLKQSHPIIYYELILGTLKIGIKDDPKIRKIIAF